MIAFINQMKLILNLITLETESSRGVNLKARIISNQITNYKPTYPMDLNQEQVILNPMTLGATKLKDLNS